MFDRSPIYYKLFCIKLSTYLKSEKLKLYSDFEKKGNNDINQF